MPLLEAEQVGAAEDDLLLDERQARRPVQCGGIDAGVHLARAQHVGQEVEAEHAEVVRLRRRRWQRREVGGGGRGGAAHAAALDLLPVPATLVQHTLRELAHLGCGLDALNEAAVRGEVKDGGLAGLGEACEQLWCSGVAHEGGEGGVCEEALHRQPDAGAASLQSLGGGELNDRSLRGARRGGRGVQA